MGYEIILKPNPGPQTAALECPISDLGYGGARGGGKGIFLILDWLRHAHACKGKARGLLLRKYLTDLRDFIRETKLYLTRLGWTFRESEKIWSHPDGSELTLAYLEREEDAERYQGWNLSWLAIDEVGQYATPAPIDRLRATLRLPGVPRHDLRLTFNPGGPGHSWLKAQYVDPAPAMVPFQADVAFPDGSIAKVWRVFIPALITDNPFTNTPEYRTSLAMAGSMELVKAWLNGDWNIVAGGLLADVWAPANVRSVCAIPSGWRIDRSFDWGSSKPFSVIWWAECDGTSASNGWCPKKGSLVAIGEWYGWNGKANEGVRMIAAEIARGILKMEGEMGLKGKCTNGVADSAIFDTENGNCIADDMARAGVRWERCQKGPGSRINGWQILRQHLQAAHKTPMEEPGVFVFDTCRQLIRTLPTLPRDPRKPEDADSNSEDHCLHGDTVVLTSLGERPIRELVGQTGMVLAHDGQWRAFSDCRLTRRRVPVVRLILSNGQALVCTGDHLILSEYGWIEADRSRGVQLRRSRIQSLTRCDTGHDQIHMPDLQRDEILPLRDVLSKQGEASPSNGLGGCAREDSCWDAYSPPGCGPGEQPACKPSNDERQGTPHAAHDSGAPRSFAGVREVGHSGGPRMAQIHGRPELAQGERQEMPIRDEGEEHSKNMRSVPRAIPGVHIDNKTGEILRQQLQVSLEASIGSGQRDAHMPLRAAIPSRALREDRTLLAPLQVEHIEHAGHADVFNLEVETVHSFAIAAGIYVHNCGDAVRYRLGTKKFGVGTVAGF